jgi:hypothetical protein
VIVVYLLLYSTNNVYVKEPHMTARNDDAPYNVPSLADMSLTTCAMYSCCLRKLRAAAPVISTGGALFPLGLDARRAAEGDVLPEGSAGILFIGGEEETTEGGQMPFCCFAGVKSCALLVIIITLHR